MPNPTGKNQYSGGRGGKKKPRTIAGKAKAMAAKTSSHPAFSLHGGATSASHEAFIRAGLAKKAAAKKKKRR